MFISDPQWLLLQPLFPSTSRGRPPLDNRLILERIFLKLITHQPWYHLPSTSPTWQTCYQHYHRWQHTGLWQHIYTTLFKDLYTRGGLDLHKLIENQELTIKRNASGPLDISFPPHLKDTWQLTTAVLVLNLLNSGL